MKKTIVLIALTLAAAGCSTASDAAEKTPPPETAATAPVAAKILADHQGELNAWVSYAECTSITLANMTPCSNTIGGMASVAQTVIEEAAAAPDLAQSLKAGGAADFAEAAQTYFDHGCDQPATYATVNACTMDYFTAKAYFTSLAAALEKAAK